MENSTQRLPNPRYGERGKSDSPTIQEMERTMGSGNGRGYTARLKALKVGDSVTFPMESRNTVRTIANRLKKDWVRLGWDYLMFDNPNNFTIAVKRIS